MKTNPIFTEEIDARLTSIYAEIMWLARRPNTSPAAARAWYTHVASGGLRRHIQMFSGKVSKKALRPGAVLRREHYKRIQTTLTSLVARHLKAKTRDPEEFMRLILSCEKVHIVTRLENYDAMKADGNYRRAGIELVSWDAIGPRIRARLWQEMLRGRVANAAKYKPSA